MNADAKTTALKTLQVILSLNVASQQYSCCCMQRFVILAGHSCPRN